MLDIKLSQNLGEALERQARRQRVRPSTLLRRAVESYLEELADYQAVRHARRSGGTPIPWANVKRRHGLAG
jgi:predicted DNA-binding protein